MALPVLLKTIAVYEKARKKVVKIGYKKIKKL